MKIISKIKDDRYLVSLNDKELANILGYYSRSSDGANDFINNMIHNEKDINICDIYQKHSLINHLQNLSEYDTARRKLKDMLLALTPIEELVTKLSEVE